MNQLEWGWAVKSTAGSLQWPNFTTAMTWAVHSQQVWLITVSKDGIYYCKYAQAQHFLKAFMSCMFFYPTELVPKKCFHLLRFLLPEEEKVETTPSCQVPPQTGLSLHPWLFAAGLLPLRKDFMSLPCWLQSPALRLCLGQADPNPTPASVFFLPPLERMQKRRILLRSTSKEKGQRPIFLPQCLKTSRLLIQRKESGAKVRDWLHLRQNGPVEMEELPPEHPPSLHVWACCFVWMLTLLLPSARKTPSPPSSSLSRVYLPRWCYSVWSSFSPSLHQRPLISIFFPMGLVETRFTGPYGGESVILPNSAHILTKDWWTQNLKRMRKRANVHWIVYVPASALRHII